MKCVIVGAGKVGFSLASTLCAEGHDITVIDNERRPLDVIDEQLNINVILGSAAKLETLHEADIAQADLMIAVTERDELNLVSGYLAKREGAKSVVARVRTPHYGEFDSVVSLNSLGVDMLINPDRVAAEEIEKLINFPEANYVGYFGNGEVQMLELHLTEECHHLNERLMDIDNPAPCIVVGIERDGDLLIPRGSDCLMAGDDILMLAAKGDMRKVENFLNIPTPATRNVVIVGGGLTAFYLATILEQQDKHLRVKMIDADLARCEHLAAELQRTTVLHCRGSFTSLFQEENVAEADVFVSVTGDDKENLFTAALAKSMGTAKTIARMGDNEYLPLIQRMGVDKTVNPHRLTTDAILRFINRSRILALTRFDDSCGQVTEYIVSGECPAEGHTLIDLNFPKSAIICMIIRGHQHLIPGGADRIRRGDRVIVFSRPEALEEVEQLFAAEEQ